MKKFLFDLLGVGLLVGSIGCGTSQIRYLNHMDKVSFERKIQNCFAKASKIEYVSDGKIDYWQKAKETEKRGKGDCEDMCIYLYDCLLKKRIKSRIVFGFLNFQNILDRSLHARIESRLGKITYVLDPVAGSIEKISSSLDENFIYLFGSNYLEEKSKEFQKRSGMKLNR